MTTNKTLWTAAAILAASMTANAAGVADAPVRQARALPALVAVNGAPSRDLGFAGWTSRFKNGSALETSNASAACDQPEREWSELLQRRVGIELEQAFKHELAQAHYPTATEVSRPSLEVSAFLNDFDLQVCPVGRGTWQGGFYVRVTWTIQESGSGRVLYQASTDGAYTSAGVRSTPAAHGLRAAMSTAVRNLLAERHVVALLQPAADVPSQLLALE